ncbi:MAG: GDSL-type esterase/lipase family protein [Bacteroidales bacterium]|nr:GDSL-type esterase/lipase family protein [Bacteroidales bacterium]
MKIKRLLLYVLLLGLPAVCFSQSKVIKIACIGNSITDGSGLKNPSTEAYPYVLQQLLGSGYEVRNFARSGTTVLQHGDNPYIKTLKFQEAKKFNPDIVTIKLGTNDTRTPNIPLLSEFEKDLNALIDTFSLLPSKPKIYLCVPVPVYRTGAFTITNEVLVKSIIPVIKRVARKRKIELIDLYAKLSHHESFFPDNVHPNKEGAELIAKTIYKALTDK